MSSSARLERLRGRHDQLTQAIRRATDAKKRIERDIIDTRLADIAAQTGRTFVPDHVRRAIERDVIEAGAVDRSDWWHTWRNGYYERIPPPATEGAAQ